MCFTCPSHASPASWASGYTRRRYVSGLTEAACWLLVPDSPFRVSWECEQPLGDRFNHVCIFFPPFSGRFFLRLSSFKPQLYISLHTNTFFFFPLGPCLLAHRGFQWHLESSKKAVVCFCAESESAVVKLCFSTVIHICQHSKGAYKYKQWIFIHDSSSGLKHFNHFPTSSQYRMCHD